MNVIYSKLDVLNSFVRVQSTQNSIKRTAEKTYACIIVIIIIHEFHRDASLETKLQGR